MKPSGHPRVHGPDVLRGLAASGVVFLHVLYLSGLEQGALAQALFGRLDFLVRLFFAISGFSLAYAYHGKLNDLGDLRAFYVRRFFRIAPLFYFVLASTVVYAFVIHGHLPSLYAILLNLTFVFSVAPGHYGSFVGGGWSIGVEWVFYLAFPAIYALIGNLCRCLLAWMVFCAIAIVGRQFYGAYLDGELLEYGVLFPLAHFQYFFIGIGVFLAHSRLERLVTRSAVNGFGVILAFVATVLYYLDSAVAHEEVVLSATILTMMAFAVAGLPAWLDNRFTRWLGRISYSIYLMQFLVIRAFADSGLYLAIGSRIPDPDTAYAVAAMVTIVAVFAVAAATWRWVEAPTQAIGKRRTATLDG